MSIKKIEKTGNQVSLSLEISLDEFSMLSSEENIEKALNEAGVAVSKLALKSFDTDGSSIELEGKRLSSKGSQKKNIKVNGEN